MSAGGLLMQSGLLLFVVIVVAPQEGSTRPACFVTSEAGMIAAELSFGGSCTKFRAVSHGADHEAGKPLVLLLMFS